MATFENWLEDMPQQFQNKKNIEIFIRAFSKQIDELLQVFDDLNEQTVLDKATGQNLKYVGDILSTSVKEAQTILKKANDDEITDETYRKVLQYKAIQNNCDCTYYDIMDSISLLWDTDKIKYVEKIEKPATIYITLPNVSIDGIDPALGRVLAIKPSGVAMIYSNGYVTGVNLSGIERAKMLQMFLRTIGVKIEEIVTPSCVISCGNIEKVQETVTANIIVWKDYWVLDGAYMLDGTRILDAKKTEEDL